jgi:acetyl-CoA carboxylase carboxyltransferase component
VIFPDTANKAAQFIEICERRHTPLLYMHNVTGFMVGKKYEHEGIIKHGVQHSKERIRENWWNSLIV